MQSVADGVIDLKIFNSGQLTLPACDYPPLQMSSAPLFPNPARGASLLLAFRPVERTVLIIGANKVAASRAFAALEAEAKVLVASTRPLDEACEEIRWRVQRDQIHYIRLSASDISASEEAAIDSLLVSLGSEVSFVCVTDTLTGNDKHRQRSFASAKRIYDICRGRRVPVNVTDVSSLCDFTFPSTHRFHASVPSLSVQDGIPSLQLAVTANGRGCRLAGRLRREVVSKLPPTLGDAVANVERLRSIAREEASSENQAESDVDNDGSSSLLNAPVAQFNPKSSTSEELLDKTRRRMRWVNQISEYWPLEKLAGLKEHELVSALADIRKKEEGNRSNATQTSQGKCKCS